MTLYFGRESSAGTAIGTDMLENEQEPWRAQSYPRILAAVGVTGSTAEGDFIADIVVGERIVATVMNTVGGASQVPNKDTDLMPVGAYVPRNSPVQMIIRDASNSNVVTYVFHFRRWNTRRRRRRTTFRRRWRY